MKYGKPLYKHRNREYARRGRLVTARYTLERVLVDGRGEFYDKSGERYVYSLQYMQHLGPNTPLLVKLTGEANAI